MNWMYLETDEEVARMEIVNSRLFDLTKRLRVKMADVCESIVSKARDDFDDDFNVEGTLHFNSLRPKILITNTLETDGYDCIKDI